MRIALVAPFGLQPKGTARYRALPLARALAARGHTPAVLIPPWDDPASGGKCSVDRGVVVRHMRLPPRAPVVFHPWLGWRLLRATLAFQPEVVHVFKPKGPSGLVAFLWPYLRRAGLTRARLVQDTDDWEGAGGWNERAGYPSWQRLLFAWQERWCLRHADAVTAASETLVARARLLGAGRAVLLPNGPPEVRPASPEQIAAVRDALGLEDAPTALLYTRFIEFAPERLVDLWAGVVAALPEARLLVVGRGARGEEAALMSLAAGRGLGHTVRLAGWLEPDVLPAHLQAARVALFPYDDTLLNRTKCSVKLVELMANGRPVVAERVGMNGHYVRDGRDGFLVRPGDAAGFVDAALRLLRDPALAAQLGEGARARIAACFSWPVLAERAEAVYGRGGLP